ncbi:hypothetical protein AMS68_002958 [Peltaster fructicola]|uniref:Uncharacterized protein n=1 Tax=Peltaster fructicola TaxID=286661 RepID=A0A6H0XS08_9PEZI|nr:hypothetical protein AMS68_002958 [Peltaster fructicola]
MVAVQDSTSPSHYLAEKPSSSFSISSAASATSAGTPRSGGSRLLFGEIDTTSERSADSYASVCNLVLSDSSTFLRFWLTDECRDPLISLLPASDLANLRLVCHDFSVRAAPALFSDLSITFKPNTFTKPSKQAALQRLGFHVKKLTFNLPHTKETFLPPLIEPETGDELSYTYIPRIQPLAIRQPRYGDWETTEILTRQYPPLFHAATNVDAFVQAFSAFVNLSHLAVACPGYAPSMRYRRSAVDFALTSIRIAVERNCLNSLDTLTLSPVHPGAFVSLTPLLGLGATPASTRRWARIKHLNIHADNLPPDTDNAEQLKLLQAYLAIFKRNLKSFNFQWNSYKGPLPIHQSRASAQTKHPALATPRPSSAPDARPKPHQWQTGLYFPHLRQLEMENATASAAEISAVVALHKRTLEELNLQAIDLTDGTWEQAFAPLVKMAAKSQKVTTEVAEIPIMLSPTTGAGFPRSLERVEVVEQTATGRRSFRASRWLGKLSQATPKTPLLPSVAAGLATKKMKSGIIGCENPVKRVFKGIPWM